MLVPSAVIGSSCKSTSQLLLSICPAPVCVCLSVCVCVCVCVCLCVTLVYLRERLCKHFLLSLSPPHSLTHASSLSLFLFSLIHLSFSLSLFFPPSRAATLLLSLSPSRS